MKSYCSSCKKEAHGKETCQEIERRQQIEALEEEGELFRLCSNCNGIIKNKWEDGEEVVCMKCRIVFSWNTGEVIESLNGTSGYLVLVPKEIPGLEPYEIYDLI